MLGFNLHWLVAHFIGDYLLQNDWMALNKKKSNIVCSIHVALYILPWLFTAVTPLQFALIALQHWLQDRTSFISWYCRTMGSFQLELTKDSLPWGHFIVDNIFHILWILAVLEWVR